MEFGTMVLSVVADGDDAATGHRTCLPELLKELPEGFAIETPGFTPKQESTIAQTHGREVTHALPCRMMIYDRVPGFRRNPHAAAGTLLLKVHFVQRPQVHGVVAHQSAEFFLCTFCLAGSARANRGRGLRRGKRRCRKRAGIDAPQSGFPLC